MGVPIIQLLISRLRIFTTEYTEFHGGRRPYRIKTPWLYSSKVKAPLSGKKWFNMRVYDIVQIDFSIPGEEREKYPRHLIRLISEVGNGRLVTIGRDTDEYVTLISDEKETTGQRNFVGELRCQILMKETDTQTGVTTIDVRVKSESEHWSNAQK